MPLVDDLSCGPIQAIDAASRASWWNSLNRLGVREVELDIKEFWARVSRSDDHLIVWTGRRSAKEFAFLLAVADAIGNRPFSIIDAAERCDPPLRHPKSGHKIPGFVSVWPSDMLLTLIGTERHVGPSERAEMRERWGVLRREDAAFRVIAGTDLVSAPETHFDDILMSEAKPERQTAARIVGRALGRDEAWMQVDELALLGRLVALTEAGRLTAEGDPWDTRKCSVHLPDQTPTSTPIGRRLGRTGPMTDSPL